jgi:hypothetical protein
MRDTNRLPKSAYGTKRTMDAGADNVCFRGDCVAKLPSGNGLPPMIAGIVGYQVK